MTSSRLIIYPYNNHRLRVEILHLKGEVTYMIYASHGFTAPYQKKMRNISVQKRGVVVAEAIRYVAVSSNRLIGNPTSTREERMCLKEMISKETFPNLWKVKDDEIMVKIVGKGLPDSNLFGIMRKIARQCNKIVCQELLNLD